MVNAYCCYRKHHEMNGSTPVSHYEFQKQVAHVWLEKKYYEKEERSESLRATHAASMSGLSTSSNSTLSSKRSRISDSALHPTKGSLNCRLGNCASHWPKPPKGKSRQIYCQLHKWAGGRRKYKDVAYCVECNVNLCLTCYERFHSTWDLVAEKSELKQNNESNSSDDENCNMV